MVAKANGSCPKCGSERIVPIAYGYPTEETFEAARRGEVALGGCIIVGDNPNRECRDCEHRWLLAEDGAQTA